MADLLWFGHHGGESGWATPTPASDAARAAAFLDEPPVDGQAGGSKSSHNAVQHEHEEQRGGDSDDVHTPLSEDGQRAIWLQPGGGSIVEMESRGGGSPARSPLVHGLASAAMDSREEISHDKVSLGQSGWPAHKHRPGGGGAPIRVARVVGGTPDRAKARAGSRRHSSMHARSRTAATSAFLGYGVGLVGDSVTLHDTTSDEDEGGEGVVKSAPTSPMLTGRVSASVSRGSSAGRAAAAAAAAAAQAGPSESRAEGGGGSLGATPRMHGAFNRTEVHAGPHLAQPQYSYELNLVRSKRPLLAVHDDGRLVMHTAASAYQPYRAVSTCSVAVGPMGVAWMSNALHRGSAWPMHPITIQDRAFPPKAPVPPRNALTIFKPHMSLDGRILPPQGSSQVGGGAGVNSNTAFSTLALAYRVQGLGSSVVKLCLHNALVAQAVGSAASDVATAWSVLAVLHVDVDVACGPAIRRWFNSYAAGVMAERARERKQRGTAAPPANSGAAGGGGGGGLPTLGLDSALLALGASLAEVVASLESEAGVVAGLDAVTGVDSLDTASASNRGDHAGGPPASSPSLHSLGPLTPKGETFEMSSTSVWLHSVRQAFVRQLFDFHALRGDVQTCVTVARVLLLAASAYQTQLAAGKSDYKVHNMNVLPDVGVGFQRLARWEERYVTLLHSLRLWSPASTIMACSSHPTIQSLNINRTAVMVARSGKKSKMALPATQRPELVMRSSMHPILVPGKRLWMRPPPSSAPDAAQMPPLAPPGSMVLAVGSLSGLAVRNAQQAAAVCAVCCSPVRGLFTQCNFCGVGGHTQCLKRWFDSHTHAPGSGGHACVRPEQSLSHSDHVRTDDESLWPSEAGAAARNETFRSPETCHGFEILL